MTTTAYIGALSLCLSATIMVVWSKSPIADAARWSIRSAFRSSTRRFMPDRKGWAPALTCAPCCSVWISLPVALAAWSVVGDAIACATLPFTTACIAWLSLPSHQRSRPASRCSNCQKRKTTTAPQGDVGD